MSEPLKIYTLEIHASPFERLVNDSSKRVLSNLPSMIEALEEDLTDLLPEGYRAVIKEDS